MYRLITTQVVECFRFYAEVNFRFYAGRKWSRCVLWSQPIVNSRFLCIGLHDMRYGCSESSRRSYGKDGHSGELMATGTIQTSNILLTRNWKTPRWSKTSSWRTPFQAGDPEGDCITGMEASSICTAARRYMLNCCPGGKESKCLHLMKSLLATTQSECTCSDIPSQMRTPRKQLNNRYCMTWI